MSPTAVPAVLVAVVSWNTRQLLDECLTSLRADAQAGRASVWVVDNASSDGSAEMVRERHPWATLVASEENLGFGRAVNLVAREAPSGWSWLAPANADVALEPGALQALVAAGEADPRAGALAPHLLTPQGTSDHSFYGFPTVAFAAAFNLSLHRVVPGLAERMCLMGHVDPQRPRLVPWAIAAFLLVRREAWEALGGFDDRQFMYAEDLDLGWQLHRAGRPTRYVPEARVVHASAAATTQAWGEARIDRAQAATYAWMLRRRGAVITRTVAAINTGGAGARWVVCAAAAKVRPGVYGPRRDWWWRWMQRHKAGLQPRRALRATV